MTTAASPVAFCPFPPLACDKPSDIHVDLYPSIVTDPSCTTSTRSTSTATTPLVASLRLPRSIHCDLDHGEAHLARRRPVRGW